jgi:hypothetical protein
MARIRTIKPDFWRDESLAMVSPEACLLAIGLLNHCDDEGYFNANPKLVESDIFPLRELSKKTTVLIQELCTIGYLELFQGEDGKTYGHVKNFEKHQVINKKTPSKIKHLCDLPCDYQTTTVVLPTGKERNGSGKEKEKKATFVATPEGVSQSVWDEFIAHRKAKKAKVTELVIEGIAKEASKAGWSLEDALKETIVRNWQSFKADWVAPKQAFANKYDVAHVTTPTPPNQDAALRKIEEDSKKAAPIPENIRAKMAELLKGKVA